MRVGVQRHTCKSAKKDEFSNIDDNRHDFLILTLDAARDRPGVATAPQTKATVHTFCAFTSRVIPHSRATCSPADCPFGYIQRVEGDCFTTNVYESGRWWLCESHFTASSSSNTLTAFIRSFFGIRRPNFHEPARRPGLGSGRARIAMSACGGKSPATPITPTPTPPANTLPVVERSRCRERAR